MVTRNSLRVGYVVKRYPRYSETFIVNEILAHQVSGLDLEIFALRPANDSHFQNRIAQVRAPVNYIADQSARAEVFWNTIETAHRSLPGFWQALESVMPTRGDDLYQALLLALAVRRRGIGHLHAHFATVATTVTRLAARLAGISYTFTAHARDIFHEDVDHGDLQRKLEGAAAVVTVSDFNEKFLRANFGPTAAHVARIYNGLDLAEFPFRSPQDRPPRIIAVGRLVEKKGFSDLVDACALLRGAGVPFTCQIIGSGEQHPMLRNQIESRGLEDYVELAGALPLVEVKVRVQESSVLAAPCVVANDGNRDGLPTVLLEAMALGTPCAATDVTGIPEVVWDDETGLMVPSRDVNALASALSRLLSDPPLRVRLARQARSLIEREFDIHRNAARLREMFCAAVKANSTCSAEAAL